MGIVSKVINMRGEYREEIIRLIGLLRYIYGIPIKASDLKDINASYSHTTGRIRHYYMRGKLFATIRARDGYLILTPYAASFLEKIIGRAFFSVYVSNEAAPFIARGRSLFAKHVVKTTEDFAVGDEVFVRDLSGRIVGQGRALLTPEEMILFNRGIAVKIRKGFKQPE